MNDLEKQVLRIIGENVASPDVFVDTDAGIAPIRDSLNDAIEEISMLTSSQVGRVYIALERNRQFYRILSNTNTFAWVTQAWDRNNNRRLEQTDLIRLRNFNARWLFNTGSPLSYFPVGVDVIGVWPRPQNYGIIELWTVMIPERYTLETDRIKLRRSFEQAAVHYAVSEYYAGRGDARRAQEHFLEYVKRTALDITSVVPEERQRTFSTYKDPWPKNSE